MRFFEPGWSVSVEDEYLHWDELRHRTPPQGLSHEEWWLALKLKRRSLYKQVPLKDAGGVPFCYLEADPIPERLHFVDLWAGGRIQMPDQITNPDTKDRYYVNSLIEEAITSSQLEGATTTRQVAKEMIRTDRSPRDKSEQMILNNFLTMKRIGELKDRPLSERLVLEIHERVTRDTLPDSSAAGRLRTAAERVEVVDHYGEPLHVPPPADQLPQRLTAMCRFANADKPFVHPVIRSIILHFWLAYDHPFVDGNGRTARAMFYWSMLHHDFWLCEFISISHIIRKAQAQYGRAFLYCETDENDLTYFILYHLDVLRRAVDELHAYIRRKTEQLHAVENLLRGTVDLNHRQRALLSHSLRHPNQRYTYESHRASHKVTRQTARTDVLDLVDRGLLVAAKIGRTRSFTPMPDLEKKLASLR
jgi:Fic family protein